MLGAFSQLRTHPRTRGEYFLVLIDLRDNPGSSPHTRGNTLLCSSRNTSPWAHPRMRGEYVVEELPGIVEWGSSPHTRGIHFHRPQRHTVRGLIPAHAGNTIRAGRAERFKRAHPRTRGEYRLLGDGVQGCRGSSPHTRGIPLGVARWRGGSGLIPAHAGNTLVNQHRNNHYT